MTTTPKTTRADVVVRAMSEGDVPAGLRLCRASGWNQVEDDWRLFLTHNPEGNRVAEWNGRVIGTVATLPFGTEFSWLSMVLVDPEMRGEGIGTVLLEEGIAAIGDSTCIRLDATPAGSGLYAKHGFVEEFGISRLGIATNATDAGLPATRVEPIEAGDLSEVSAYDREVFGADRSFLLCALFERAPQYAWVSRDGRGAVEGYSFGRPGFLYDQLGPVVAEGVEVAQALVVMSLSRNAGQRFAIDAPQLHESWICWLQSRGFTEERTLLRMYRGDHRHRGLPERQFAITGPEFG